jgi:hypothetical protein
MVVLNRDRQGTEAGPRLRAEAAPLALPFGAEQAILERRLGRVESGDELTRGGVGAGGAR